MFPWWWWLGAGAGAPAAALVAHIISTPGAGARTLVAAHQATTEPSAAPTLEADL